MRFAVFYHIVDRFEDLHRIAVRVLLLQNGPVEAAAVPGMAGRADLGDFYKDCIIVAINTHLLQVLEMTACQSLYP